MNNQIDLEKMTDEEYKAMKAAEMAEAKAWMDAIAASDDPIVMYKIGRPVCDLKQLFESSAEQFGDKVLYHQVMKGDKEFSTISYREALTHVQGLGTRLINLGLKGAHIGVIGPNCYEWVESYHAIIGGTGIVVPLDRELPKEELSNLCNVGGITAVICCSDKHYKMFKEIKDEGSTDLEFVIGINMDSHEDPDDGLYSWNLLREEGMQLVKDGDRNFLDARIRNTDLAAIIFTSGTTGVAKGVMLSHRNLCADVMISQPYLEVRPSDIFFSVLPLHHTYECTCSMLEGLYMGSSLAFCRGLKYITRDMQMVQPTFLLAVPAIYEKFYRSINKSLVKQGKDKSFKKLMAINAVTSKLGINVAGSAIEKITAQFGGKIRMFIAGGAKVDPDVLAFFRSLGIKTLQGYGLTETAPMVALNPDQWKYMKNDSAGRVFMHTEYKVVNPDENGNGELCFRGPQVMLGYYNNPEATAACMEDGWFHTGDLGHIDDDRYVYITGRMKNVIIAANGKNVFPEELEEKLLRSKYIEECMVWADETGETGHKGIWTTLRLDQEHIEEALGKDADEESIRKLIDSEIDAVNEQNPDWKAIRNFRIRKTDFVKTTGMKIKRFVPENKEA
ncbi:MAG: AMP-binding protein [Clostridiales bacterium]|nr:AMP-binding protein [Candidatus Crickella equi]